MDDTARQGVSVGEARPMQRVFFFLVNPKLHYSPYPDWAKWLPIVDGGGAIDMQWNTGSRHPGMEPGDPALLAKVGVAPRGLVVLGKVTGTVYEGPHRNPDVAHLVTGWVDIRLTALLDLDDPSPLSVLEEIGPGIRWTPHMSGVEVLIGVGEEVRGLVAADVWPRRREPAAFRSPPIPLMTPSWAPQGACGILENQEIFQLPNARSKGTEP